MADTPARDFSTTYLTTGQAAAYLGVSVRQLEGILDRGDLPRYKPGKYLQFELALLDAYKLKRTRWGH